MFRRLLNLKRPATQFFRSVHSISVTQNEKEEFIREWNSLSKETRVDNAFLWQYPCHAIVSMERGRANVALGDYESAIYDFKQAGEIDSSYANQANDEIKKAQALLDEKKKLGRRF